MGMSFLQKAAKDERGVSAVEFAIILPLFLVIYTGATELSSAYMGDRKLNHAASAVSDLATQQPSLTTSQISDIFSAASIILQPFSTQTLSLRLTSITQKADGSYVVDWSQAQGTALPAYAKGQTYGTLPSGVLVNTGDNVVMSEANYAFTSAIAFALPKGLTFADTAYARPRSGSTIPCSNC